MKEKGLRNPTNVVINPLFPPIDSYDRIKDPAGHV